MFKKNIFNIIFIILLIYFLKILFDTKKEHFSTKARRTSWETKYPRRKQQKIATRNIFAARPITNCTKPQREQ